MTRIDEGQRVEAAGPRGLPVAALWLGGTGVLPFLGAAMLALLGGEETAAWARFALLGYGAVILSFLGGVLWGTSMAAGRADWPHLSMSVAPSLLAWGALLVGGQGGLAILAAALSAMLIVDLLPFSTRLAARWYPMLRIWLTLGAVGALTLALFGS